VQLLALATMWEHLAGTGAWTTLLAWSLIFATWTFFIGPLARAVGHPRVALIVERAGAVIALPAYLALPAILLA
jgi:hypothetical protein